MKPTHETETEETDTPVAEFTVPEGCIVCGGELTIRARPGGVSGSYCPSCHWVARPTVRAHGQGLEIAYPTLGAA